MTDDAKRLIDAARDAAQNAYAPYSGFAVGAAILLSDGEIVTGANFENASYGLSLCAETVAMAKVGNLGRLGDVVAVGISGSPIGVDSEAAVHPCGRCRQILNEAAQLGGRDLAVHCAGSSGDVYQTHHLSTLLPHAFGPADLPPQKG
ncbi:cytidine deaminase [Stakelama sp. CBK3Z-3]|uniref:Cytidine deaminase n=1 Tax=Stakelama flava TaxID=2860338 RepID=A0ABS6XJY9_9SPHN|nr:cytidine deaminase [Stakelama flava]MBW4330507.1 cytidine deaminase [Stakelama flava]